MNERFFYTKCLEKWGAIGSFDFLGVDEKGNSSEPHLHSHLPVFQDALGIKVRFQQLVATTNGKSEMKPIIRPSKAASSARANDNRSRRPTIRLMTWIVSSFLKHPFTLWPA